MCSYAAVQMCVCVWFCTRAVTQSFTSLLLYSNMRYYNDDWQWSRWICAINKTLFIYSKYILLIFIFQNLLFTLSLESQLVAVLCIIKLLWKCPDSNISDEDPTNATTMLFHQLFVRWTDRNVKKCFCKVANEKSIYTKMQFLSSLWANNIVPTIDILSLSLSHALFLMVRSCQLIVHLIRNSYMICNEYFSYIHCIHNTSTRCTMHTEHSHG